MSGRFDVNEMLAAQHRKKQAILREAVLAAGGVTLEVETSVEVELSRRVEWDEGWFLLIRGVVRRFTPAYAERDPEAGTTPYYRVEVLYHPNDGRKSDQWVPMHDDELARALVLRALSD